MAAAYAATDRCVVDVEPLDDGDWGVYLRIKNSADIANLSAIADELRNEVVDQQLRLDLEKRYAALRDTIVSCAFDPLSALRKKKQR